MLFWTSVVLQLDVAPFGRISLLSSAQTMCCNAGVNEEDEMDKSKAIFVSECTLA